MTEAIIAAFVFLLAFYIIHFLSETISEKENYRKENIKNLKFKKDYKELKGNADIVTQDLRLIERFFCQIRKLLGYQI
ncbi:MAG: hypothetical protein ABS44_10870 [Chryseobacterium sp. SCN 40-13]|nr:MAG: hypothetical protein ABS44_10870 [Chryseobacterium sp. SCN 40-13]